MIKLKSLILELNLFDHKDLVAAIESILKDKDALNNLEIVDWFKKQYLKWYISSVDDNEKHNSATKHSYKQGEPEWASKKDIFDFKGFPSEHVNELNHIIDFFQTLNEIEIKKIYKITFPVVRKLIIKWDKRLKNRMGKKVKFNVEGKDLKTLKSFSDGYKIVDVLSPYARKEEGELVGHCVSDINYEKSRILSLRDGRGVPHVTMELKVNGIYQIKGKENKAPVDEYKPYIINFIDENNLDVRRDGQNIGFIEWEDEYYNPDKEKWKEIYQNKIIPMQNVRFDEIRSRIKNGIIDGDVSLTELYLLKLPDFLRGISIKGYFYCDYNQLTSLQGVPQTIGGSFGCSHNQLTSLQGAPQTIGGDFYCSHNQLTSLQGAPQTIGMSFYCNNNRLTSLQGAPQSVGESFGCNNNKLTSLQGGPQSVGRDFGCSHNQLTSLQGVPQTIGGSFGCSHNKLTSLQGGPQSVGRDFMCDGNRLTSLEGCPQSVVGGFYCTHNNLTSLQGAPQSVGGGFFCGDNPGNFTREQVRAVCQVTGAIVT